MATDYKVSLQKLQLDKAQFSGMEKALQHIEPSLYYSQELSDFSVDSDIEELESKYYTAYGQSIFSQYKPKKSLPSDTDQSSDSEASVSDCSDSIVSHLLQPNAKRFLECHQSTPIKTQREENRLSNKTADIVHDLVLERYGETYSNLLRKLRKSKLTVEEDMYMSVVAEMNQIFKVCQDKDVSSILKDLAQEKVNKSNYINFQDKPEFTEETKTKSSEDTAIVKGDEITEEGDRTYFCCSTASIGTEDISEILSCTSSYESSYHYNSTDSTTDISQQPDLIREPFRYSYASYQDVTSMGMEIYSDEGRNMIKNHICINEVIMEQAMKMLEYGQKKKGFMGSPVHLEGERIL